MKVRARAPGKIILSGEHAVVHGSTAVASSINLYSFASLDLSSDDGMLKLELKDTELEFLWPTGRIREVLPGFDCPSPSIPKSCSTESYKSIVSLLEEQNIPEAKITLASGVSTFIWLYTAIHGYKPGKVTIYSELPLGAGLGSSAAFCVSLCGALLALSNCCVLDYGQQGWVTMKESELDLVNKWAFEGEKIIHGRPSGIDNTVSTYGNLIQFRSGELTRLKSNLPLKMLITNTQVGRNTKALVAGVSERTLRHPDVMASVFSAVDSISKELSTVLQTPVADDIAITEQEDKLEELMEMNQGLLQCMGVSHVSIETVLRTTLKYKLKSKLTGAGGGGCVLTLLPTLLSSVVVDKVVAELEACGFQCLIAEIGGNGVEVCFDNSSRT
ncbi:unnamed protein product [Amaranthus hypochondriacus]